MSWLKLARSPPIQRIQALGLKPCAGIALAMTARMSQSDDLTVVTAMRSTAEYLHNNPLASDTSENIRRWWLNDAALTPTTIQRALDELTRRGVVSVQTAADEHRRYRFSGDLAALQAVLRNQSDGGGPH